MKQALKTIGGEGAADAASLGANQSGMRASNERLVLTLIRQSGPMAKADIARITGLSAQAVSVIMRSLEADGLLAKGEPVRGKVGQPSVPMGLACDGAFFFGLKVGRRSLDLVLTDFLGQVRERIHRTHAYPTPDGVVSFAKQAIGQILDRLSVDHRARVAGLGIALPFQLWDWADAIGVEAAEMAIWRDRDIAAEIGAACQLPVFVCNDASAACGAELVFGDQQRPRDFLYLFLGFFVGGGLVLNGALYTGPGGNAAALGSMRIPTPDGRMRQLVDVASLAELERAHVAAGGVPGTLWDDPVNWNLPDAVVETWLDGAATGMAHAILSAVCLIDVTCVLIDGWVPPAIRAELVRRTESRLAAFAMPGIEAPAVSEGTIGSDARALGAASLPLSERFLIDRNTVLKG